jgi:tetratricopeptide (TPR) repeat protein
MMAMKHKIRIISVLLLIFGLTASGQDLATLQGQIDQAKAMLENNDLMSAEMFVQQVLAQDSSFAPAYYLLHEIELRRGNLTEAQQAVRKAIDFNPTDETYRERFDQIRDLVNMIRDGQREYDAGNPDNAKRVYLQVAEKYPNFADTYYRLGVIALLQDDHEAALKYYDKAIELSGGDEKYTRAKRVMVQKYYQDGLNAYKINDLTTAEKKLNIAISIDPTFSTAYQLLGAIKRKAGDIEKAIDYLQQGIEANANDEALRYNLAIYLQNVGEHLKALEQLKKCVEINPNYDKAYAVMGRIYLDRKNLKEAEASYAKAVSLDKTSAAAWEGYGAVLMELDRYEEAVEALKNAAKYSPRNAQVYYRLAEAYNYLEKYELAIEAAKNATQINSNFGAAWYEMGMAFALMGNNDDAINAFNRARTDARWRKVAEYEIEQIRKGKPVSRQQ